MNGVGGIHAAGPAGDNQPFAVAQFLQGLFWGADPRLDPRLANPPRDEMTILTTRINDNNLGHTASRN
jgi:hypothetical protein